MTRPAIIVENLGKEYQIGLAEPRYRTLRDVVADFARAPLARFRRLSGALGKDERFWALRDVSFEVQPGEVVGIIGRNGAGKSTLLKILSRITEPTEGQARLHGRVASLLEVGTGFHPELTGRENIYLNGSILGMSRCEIGRKFDEIVAFSGVEKFLDTPVKRYSSGMKVRLAFSVAAHLEPEILVVDEVLAVGDAEFQARCLGKMSDVATQGRTILFVSHNMAAVEGLCTSGILLEEGAIAAMGDSSEVVGRYLDSGTPDGFDFDLGAVTCQRDGRFPVCRRLRIVDAHSAPISSVRTGDDVRFELDLLPQHLIRYLRVAIRIFNSLGQRVTTCHNDYQHREVFQAAGCTRISCTMKNCRLAPGTYSIELQVDDQRQMLERIERGIRFTVVPHDVYGTGRVMPKHAALFLPEVAWDICELHDIS